MNTTTRQRLSGSFELPLPREQAFQLFTPEGERRWVADWNPHYPAGAVDDTEPGTVFQTTAQGQRTTWVVVARERGRMMSYARVADDSRAGTVTVTLDDIVDGTGCVVTVVYDLTPLSAQGAEELDDFASTYPDFLNFWRESITQLQ